jgi:diadenosine tetraphosphate (Ap4A) HIT family hydrolase
MRTEGEHGTRGTCRANSGDLAATGGVIHQDAEWRAEHALEPIPMAGWVVLKPLRPVESFADLTIDEAAGFGLISRRLTHAMTALLGATKVYLCLVAEQEHFAHIHVHLIPRLPGARIDRRGPNVFEYMREARTGGNLGEVAVVVQFAASMRDALGGGTARLT